MEKMFKKADLSVLSEKTGLTKAELKFILSEKFKAGTLDPKLKVVNSDSEEVVTKVYIGDMPKVLKTKILTLKEKIEIAESVDDLGSIVAGASYDDPDFAAAYNKLLQMLHEELGSEDLDEVSVLFTNSPVGSAIENDVLEKETRLLQENCKNYDIDELTSLYSNDDYTSEQKDIIADEILLRMDTLYEIENIFINFFREGTKHWYAAAKRRDELVKALIAGMTSVSEVEDHSQYIIGDNELLLAEQCVKIASDFDELKEAFDYIGSDSDEANEIIGLGLVAIAEDVDQLSEIFNTFNDGTKVYRLAFEKYTSLLRQMLQSADTIDELEEIKDTHISKGTELYNDYEVALLSKCVDIDEVKDIIDNYLTMDSVAYESALEKYAQYLQAKIDTCAGLDYLDEAYVYIDEDYCPRAVEVSYYLKVVDMVNTKDDFDTAAGLVYTFSEARYLLHQKYKDRFTFAGQSVVASPVVVDTPKEEVDTDDTAERLIEFDNAMSISAKYRIYKTTPKGAPAHRHIHRKYEQALVKEIGRLKTEQGLLGIKSYLEADSITRYVWVRKLATIYKRPWWKFVQ